MLKTLVTILDIQELDMQMIQLMRLKNERKKELENINAVKENLRNQMAQKQLEIKEFKKECRFVEEEIAEAVIKSKKLETQQNAIKKVEEFNALSQEIAHADKEKSLKELRLSDLIDREVAAEEALKAIKEALESTVENSKILESEIYESIIRINEEGRTLKAQRDELVSYAEPEIYRIYDRLLRNKKDRVVVPIENRCCSGCHIMLTAQDENLVRKGERLVFCEHCSRIHYWQEASSAETSTPGTKRRRRAAT